MPPAALRVHYVLIRFPKLSETFVLREMRELERVGWAVSVDTLESPLDEPRDPALAELRAPVRRMPDEPDWTDLLAAHARLAARRPGAWLRAALRAWRERRFRHFLRAGLIASRAGRDGADLLLVHFAYYSAEYARDASELTGIPFAVVAHANDIWSDFNAPHLRRRLEGAAGVATPTEYNAKALRARVPGLPVRRLSAIVATQPLERVDRDGPVLAVGRAVPKKGIDTLVEACAIAARRGEPVRAEVLGDGPELIGLGELAAARSLDGNVLFRGACPPDQVSEAYARCSVVVVPSRIAPDGDRDGLPTVLFEAMGRGLPVIATDVVGISELVEDGKSGLLVPPDDPEALADAILRVRRDPGLAERLGSEARRTIEREHLPEHASEELRRWLLACARPD
jgi:glycosyltransferase involved in cell wall biosynthesis